MIRHKLICSHRGVCLLWLPRPAWSFAGRVERRSQIISSVHWSECTILPASPVQHVSSKLESSHSLRGKLERCIALRITTGMRLNAEWRQQKQAFNIFVSSYVVINNILCVSANEEFQSLTRWGCQWGSRSLRFLLLVRLSFKCKCKGFILTYRHNFPLY